MNKFFLSATVKIATAALALIQVVLGSHNIHLPEFKPIFEFPYSAEQKFQKIEPKLTAEMPKVPEGYLIPPVPSITKTLEKLIAQPAPKEKKVSPQDVVLNTPSDWQTIFNRVSHTAVHIICSMKIGNLRESITGSGVYFGNPNVILTNAHVAEYFLLPNFTCTVSGQSAKLLYISKSWIQEHYSDINNLNASGTGEKDFALILASGSEAPLYSEENSDEITSDKQVLMMGYPAGESLASISLLSALVSIKDVLSFGGYGDLFSVEGSLVAARGSSGGPIVDENGKLLGITVTSTSAASVDEREARAISIPYIKREFKKEMGLTLDNFLSGDVATEANAFHLSEAPHLSELLSNSFAAR